MSEEIFQNIEAKLRKESAAHIAAADSCKFESQIWGCVLVLGAFCMSLFSVISEQISHPGFTFFVKIFTTAILPLLPALSIWRAAPANETMNRKLAAAKRSVADVITEESLRTKELREPPDDFLDKIRTMIDIIDRFSF